jgi:Holliday junction resolvase-like predicted endonuclease
MKRETREMKKSLEQMYAESRRETKELNRQLGGISNSNGDMAETYFYNAFKVSRIFAGEKFDQIQQNTKGSNGEVEAEFDLILFNGKSVAIIEVKYKAKPDNISVKRLIARVSKFKILYPAYQNHYIYLGVAALTFGTGMEERLRRNGIATIHQIGKKMVIYDQDLKTF